VPVPVPAEGRGLWCGGPAVLEDAAQREVVGEGTEVLVGCYYCPWDVVESQAGALVGDR